MEGWISIWMVLVGARDAFVIIFCFLFPLFLYLVSCALVKDGCKQLPSSRKRIGARSEEAKGK